MNNNPKLLPMPPLCIKECYPPGLYNLPPTYKEGAKKVIIIRDITLKKGYTPYKAGMKGIVIPIRPSALGQLFTQVKLFFEDYPAWKHWDYPCRLDRTYDFFPFFTDKKGEIRISQYHDLISSADFQYL